MSDVIDINRPKPESEEKAAADSFEDIIKRNAENAERVKRERQKDNEGIKRSHRLKKDK